jgi:hypothetical protein
VRPEVELMVTAGDIPDHITVDLAGLDIGDVTTSSVTLPAGAKPTIDRDFVIANISAPSQFLRDQGRGHGLGQVDFHPVDLRTQVGHTGGPSAMPKGSAPVAISTLPALMDAV